MEIKLLLASMKARQYNHCYKWTFHKSHLFYHMRNGVKTCRWQGTLISDVLVFISETCWSCHPH